MQKRIPLYAAEIEGFAALTQAAQRLAQREAAAFQGVMERAGVSGNPVGFDQSDLIIEVPDGPSPPTQEPPNDRPSPPAAEA